MMSKQRRFSRVSLLAGCVGFLSIFAGTASADTSLERYITEDMTLTKANSPYTAGDGVWVNRGVTLTIEPGVTVYLNLADYDSELFIVEGILKAIGTEEERIVFSDNPESFTWQWVAMVLRDSTSAEGTVLKYCTFTHVQTAIICENVAPIISHCTFQYVEGVSVKIARGNSGLVPEISFNDFKGGGSVGIQILATSALIEHNIFYSFPVSVSIGGDANPVLHYNIFNGSVGSRSGTPNLIDARYNYWGTNDEEEIKDMVTEHNILYKPWLTSPPEAGASVTGVQPATWGQVKSFFR